jgi:hypothetical protein
MIFLVIPYLFALIGIPGLMTIPYYYFNKFLLKKINPRESGVKLLLFFIITILAVFIYMTVGIYAIIWVAKFMQ